MKKLTLEWCRSGSCECETSEKQRPARARHPCWHAPLTFHRRRTLDSRVVAVITHISAGAPFELLLYRMRAPLKKRAR